jgi:hypothetical protein
MGFWPGSNRLLAKDKASIIYKNPTISRGTCDANISNLLFLIFSYAINVTECVSSG